MRKALVRVAMRSISAGIAALAIGIAVKSGWTPASPADAGLRVERSDISVFGAIHLQALDLRPPVRSQIPARPAVRVASLETAVDSFAAEEEETQAQAPTSTTHYASFDERFAFSLDKQIREEDDSVMFGAPVWPMPLAAALPAPSRTFASPAQLHANSVLLPDSAKPETTPPSVSQPTPESATVARPPAPAASKEPVRAAEARDDSTSLPDSDSRTAIYDIAAHAVYLPNGDRLEAHSGLAGNLDNPQYVSLKGRGPTPPNVYNLTLRKQPFHGIRAIRLIPVGEGKMFGRDGILAHSYMLGPNGQSNGCVSFSNYPAFLNAFLRGEVDRLVVVEHLANAPSPSGVSGWLQEALRNLFRSS